MSDLAAENSDDVADADATTAADDTVELDDDRSAFDYDDPEFLAAVERAADGRFQQTLERLAADEQSNAELEGIDPGLLDVFNRMIEQGVQKAIGPMAPTIEAFEDQQRVQQVEMMTDKLDGLKDVQDKLGEFGEDRNPRESVQYMASGFYPDLEARYGQGDRALQTSLRMAAEQYQGDIDAAYKAGYKARDNEYGARSNTREPAPAHTESVTIRDEPETIMAAAEQFIARRNLE